MEHSVSSRAKAIPPFLAMEVLERAQALERAGRSIIHLSLGEPDFPTPSVVVEAAFQALREHRTRYTHSLGLLELREAIAAHYGATYGVDVSPEQIMVTCGTSPAMLLLFAALLDPGDEVILPNPHYACYPQMIEFAGGRPVYVEVDEADGFQLRVEAVAKSISPRTKAIFINSPANPTGTVLEPSILEGIAELGRFGIGIGPRQHADRAQLAGSVGIEIGHPQEFHRPREVAHAPAPLDEALALLFLAEGLRGLAVEQDSEFAVIAAPGILGIQMDGEGPSVRRGLRKAKGGGPHDQ